MVSKQDELAQESVTIQTKQGTPQQIEQYIIGKFIARGAYGSVNECIEKSTNQQYVLKRIPHRCAETVELEFSIMKQLDSSGYTVKAIQHYYDSKFHYLVLECLGQDLYKSVLKHGSGFDIQTIKTIGRQLLNALQKMQDQEILHNDIKPENILFDRHVQFIKTHHNNKLWKSKYQITPVNPSVKIIDFGLSTFKRNSSGTCNYMSPYQLLSNIRSSPNTINITYQNDLWALACVMYEMYTSQQLVQISDQEQCEYIESLCQIHCKLGNIKSLLVPKIFTTYERETIKKKLTNYKRRNCDKVYTIQQILDDKELLDFLNFILVIDITKMPTLSECLNHQFMKLD